MTDGKEWKSLRDNFDVEKVKMKYLCWRAEIMDIIVVTTHVGVNYCGWRPTLVDEGAQAEWNEMEVVAASGVH